MVKRRPEVDVHQLLPFAERRVGDFSVIADARVIDEHVELAEFFHDIVAQAFNGLEVGNVDNLGENIDAVLREPLFRIFERHFVDVSQHEAAARFGEKACGVETNTASSTGDEYDFVPEFFHRSNLHNGERGVNKK